ncbi:VOC family protein [Clostridium sp.]|uniref:VOC family protein n=1 Tax=Clostridium sp. TaxID=1506 RepID=UPI0025C5A485|nr:VOC family protein [Clostridium sp.]
MNIKFVTITVKNLKESVKFYEDVLKLEIAQEFSPMKGTNIAFLKGESSAMLELIEYENKSIAAEVIHSKVSIGFESLDLDITIKELEGKNIKIIRGPIKTPGGERFIFIEDPNGVEIELIEGFSIN